MFGDLLSLNDRIEPGGANDEDEVIKLASALDEVEGRKPVHREVGEFDQNAVIERTRKFQRARGLKADGLVNPNGPTAQRIAAEQFRRRPARPIVQFWAGARTCRSGRRWARTASTCRTTHGR